jgi:hypothetical protein
MFINACLSILQICVLPGLLILAFFNLRNLDRVILAFPLSLLCNYFLVYLLTLLGCYTRNALIGVFILECALIYILYTKYPKHRVSALKTNLMAQPDWKLGTNLRIFFFFLAMLATCWLIFKLKNVVPSNFNGYDDTCNWNRWAMEWYKGMWPWRTWEYPQMLPTNWSINYKWIGSYEVEYFVTFINGLMPLYAIAAFWALYIDTGLDVFLIAISVFGFWLYFFLSQWLGVGMADVPSAFFGVMLLYVAFLGTANKISFKQFIILGALIVTGAALTKQAGNYLIVFYLFVSVFIARANKLRLGLSVKWIALGLGIILLLAWSWYIHHHILYKKGLVRSNIYYVTQVIYEGRNYWQRFVIANMEIKNNIHVFSLITPQAIFNIAALLIAFLLYLSLQASLGAITTLAVTIPFYLIWAVFFSYGHNQRNFGLGIGYLSFSIACGLCYLCAVLKPYYLHKKPMLTKAALTILGVVIAAFSLAELNKTITAETVLSTKIHYLKLTSAIYAPIYKLYHENHFTGIVLTNFGCDSCNAFPGTHELFTTIEPDNFIELKKLIFSGKYDYYLSYKGVYTPDFYDQVADLAKQHLLTKEYEVFGGDAVLPVSHFILYKIKK